MVKVIAKGWAGHKEGMVVAENLSFFITTEQKTKSLLDTHFLRTKAKTALQSSSQVSVLLGCDAVSPGTTHAVTQRHTDHSTTVLLLTDH